MGDVLIGILSEIDPKVVYIAVGLLAVSALISLIKKAIKIAVIVIIVALCISYLAPLAKQIQKDYKVSIEDDKLYINIKGREFELSKEGIEKIKLEHLGLKGYKLEVNYKDGFDSIMIPNFLINPIKKFIEDKKLPVTIIE